ncbi:MFS transporter [Bordetella bronchialis]|uniref:MFS transporter n=1 Tax=Bordetella bronchialis TaxID=463025 RepID=A0A193FQ37_9BORD|nr:MFS transporter [Bordetella bronchialis]ANN69398.1 MFS transporter [Bordetella bronchialis]ANN74544.1 MFS transporter [Bordetella bronchialis]
MTSPDAARADAAASLSATDLHSRRAAATLALSLPGDTVLYLLLPMYASQFGVTLAEAGVLLAANRLVRIAGYGAVARFYARHGDRPTCMLAAAAAAASALGYATLSGFWALVPLRLLWGLAFAALNLSTQAMATADPRSAARRNGRSRAVIAMGPVLALPTGAWLADQFGPRLIFLVLAVAALAGIAVARGLPSRPHPAPASPRRLRLPGSLDVWSFLEGFTLDGLFIIGLSYMGKDLMPAGSVIVAGAVLALRYLGEIVLSPVGGRLADRFGAERLLVALSLSTAAVLAGFGAGWIWSCAAAIVVLRALQLPLLPPIVAMRTPGPGRVQALAARSVWRDIGAGTGPLLAGVVLPHVPAIWIYSVPAVLLAIAALACVRPARPDAAPRD